MIIIKDTQITIEDRDPLRSHFRQEMKEKKSQLLN